MAVLAAGRDQGLPTYTNAQVLAVDVTARTLVIKNARGAQEKVELDDQIAGFEDVKAGDHVILALRGEPGRARVSAIIKSKRTAASQAAAAAPSPAGEAAFTRAPGAVSTLFANRVAALVPQADRVDRVWGEFRQACDVAVGARYDGGREWFALWDGHVRADLSDGFCRDLQNQVVALGEPVNLEMAAAEDAARRSLVPGDIREVRRRYALEWDGWGRIPPKLLEK